MFLQTEKQFNYRLHYTGDIFRRVVNKISNHLRKTNENLIQDCWKLILKLIIIKHTFRKNIKMVTKLQNEMES